MLCNELRASGRLHAMQLDALQRLVRHAGTHVPFYRDLYRTHGVDVERFDARRDVERLPLTAKHQWRKAQYLRPYLRAGRRVRDKVLRLTAFPAARRSLSSRLGVLREWQFNCATPAAELHSHWHRIAPDVLQGYPSALRTLANFCLESGAPLDPAPRMVFCDSELLLPDTRALLRRAFGTEVIDIFGTYETDNIAWQCGRNDGYHVATDCVLLEIIRDGRADDLIALDDGASRTPMDVLGRLDRFIDLVRHYQLRQLDTRRFELLIVPARPVAAADSANLIAAVREALPSAAVGLKLVDDIPPQKSGKRLAFVRA
jgi:hypothetical protein